MGYGAIDQTTEQFSPNFCTLPAIGLKQGGVGQREQLPLADLAPHHTGIGDRIAFARKIPGLVRQAEATGPGQRQG